MEKSKLHQLIKEMIKEEESNIPNDTKISSGAAIISKDLEDQTSAFNSVNTKDKMVELLNIIKSKLNPKFIESPAFSQAIREFLKNNS